MAYTLADTEAALAKRGWTFARNAGRTGGAGKRLYSHATIPGMVGFMCEDRPRATISQAGWDVIWRQVRQLEVLEAERARLAAARAERSAEAAAPPAPAAKRERGRPGSAPAPRQHVPALPPALVEREAARDPGARWALPGALALFALVRPRTGKTPRQCSACRERARKEAAEYTARAREEAERGAPPQRLAGIGDLGRVRAQYEERARLSDAMKATAPLLYVVDYYIDPGAEERTVGEYAARERAHGPRLQCSAFLCPRCLADDFMEELSPDAAADIRGRDHAANIAERETMWAAFFCPLGVLTVGAPPTGDLAMFYAWMRVACAAYPAYGAAARGEAPGAVVEEGEIDTDAAWVAFLAEVNGWGLDPATVAATLAPALPAASLARRLTDLVRAEGAGGEA